MRVALVALAVIGMAGKAVAAEPQFSGKWNCEVATFTFSSKIYNNGSRNLLIKSIEKSGRDYLITFPDGYRISLFNVQQKTMTWHSPISGDTFDCRRVK